MESEVKEKEKETKNNEKGYVKDKKCYDDLQSELTNYLKAMEKIDYREGHMEDLQEKRYTLKIM